MRRVHSYDKTWASFMWTLTLWLHCVRWPLHSPPAAAPVTCADHDGDMREGARMDRKLDMSICCWALSNVYPTPNTFTNLCQYSAPTSLFIISTFLKKNQMIDEDLSLSHSSWGEYHMRRVHSYLHKGATMHDIRFCLLGNSVYTFISKKCPNVCAWWGTF